ncbi:DUF3320 domain-containing protein [Planococcus sp. APC 4015]|nr:DUF3320 domain-containing protein [Planococcus sp. APC 4015]
MLMIDSQVDGAIEVVLRTEDGDPVARHEMPVTVLASTQWIAQPPQLGFEMLASFVQPNSAAVDPLLREASDILLDRTGDSALTGYQSGDPARVDAIVHAIFDAMAARDIRYAEPPASWGVVGQKVRTPAEVLEGRLGTCLDTTVTLAAVLEQAGINSTLWLVAGHIFLGYWRHDSTLEAPADQDASDAVNLVGLGSIGLVETTSMTTQQSFATARRRPHLEHLDQGAAHFVAVTDVRQARLSRILPLPSRSVSSGGEVVVTEYQVAAAPDALHYTPSAEAMAGSAQRDIPARVAQWKNALLDLSLRNRLINFGEKGGYSLAVPQPAVAAFEDLINARAPVTLLPSDRVPTIEKERGIRWGRELPEELRASLLLDRKQVFVDVTDAAYTTRLRALAYKARTIVEETGANNLYLAFGMLQWTFNDRTLRSPLVLVPVTLESVARGQTYRITLDEAGESTPNYCLLEKLRVSFGIDIPGLANPARDDSGIDLRAAFAATRHALAQAKLPFTVEDSVDLSILQFAKYRLWRDLDENWQALASNALVSHLVHTPTVAFEDPVPAPPATDLDALGNAVPVAADSSQLDAVAEAVADRTFVLEGPPGTGKSQTITNLLAHSLANGKRVLFVAEKRAALDVVKQRLEGVGLGPFCLDLHDKGARPSAARAQIKAAIDAFARPDAAALKASLEAAAASRGSLKRYADRLHSANAAGLSLYSARTQLLASAPDVPTLEVATKYVAAASEEQLEAVRARLRALPETADLAHPAARHGWGFVDLSPDRTTDARALHIAAEAFDRALEAAVAAGADATMLHAASSPQHLERWAGVARAPRFGLDAVDAFHTRTLSGEVPLLLRRLDDVDAAQPAWFATLAPEALDLDTTAIHDEATAADASGFFGRKRRRRAALARFGSTLRVDPKQFPPAGIAELAAAVVQTKEEVATLRASLLSMPIPLADPGWSPYREGSVAPVRSQLGWAAWLAGALSADGGDIAVRDGLRAFYRATSTDGSLAQSLTSLATTLRQLTDLLPGGEHALTSWADENGWVTAWVASRAQRNTTTAEPVSADRWIAFLHALEPLREQGLLAARTQLLTGAVAADVASLAFDKGVAQASTMERAESQALVEFDVSAHNRTIERFTSSAASIRSELPRWIPAEILAKRRIDPSYEGGAMGELKRQLGRQRGGMSVRSLFENFGELITQIAPCVLMSPESVSRFFPARAEMFDIVVFDEASQIRVADAVGAMGRGRSVVVVGDSKQMPPTSFAEIGTDIETESAPDVVADEESILTECVQARVPSKWLSWHYRSQDESLIMFSNHAYYESRLSSFPAPWGAERESVGGDDHGLSLVRVDGRFNRSGRGRDLRTNVVEAAAIVDEIARRFADSPSRTPSLGVITFNAQQRALIESLLREHADERLGKALDERDGVFVKNLENVQGDERDVILFSVAFSANDRGFVPLNFGPLSRAGGERRLNVAITRARRQVILYASFDPSELRAEHTASVGIKHLKGYLELAASGVESETDSAQRQAIVDRHRDEIADELRYRGFAVRTDVGLSDFRVDISVASAADPAQPLVAVLLDGENWRARRTVADRDGLPVEVLKGLMRWPGVERVWLPEWLQQREATLSRIEASVAAAEIELLHRGDSDGVSVPVPVPVQTPAIVDPAVALEAADVALLRQVMADDPAHAAPHEARHPHLREYVPFEPKLSGTTETLDRLPSTAASERVRSVIRQVVDREGPVHKVRLAKLVASSFGLSKVAAARSEAILRCIPPELLRAGDRTSVWPTALDPDEWREVRRSRSGDGRNLDHVPLEEIANAMLVVAELGGGMNDEDIKREALSIFGGKRLTAGISARLDEALGVALHSGRIKAGPAGLWVAATS